MRILENIEVPTGNILIVDGEKGLLECLSLGDYGKAVNLNPDEAVQHTELLPLDEKWVCTISTQYGCSMHCAYCDVPLAGPGKNATFSDLVQQIITVRNLHPGVTTTRRFNIHFARMGEPTWNPNILDAAKWVRQHFYDPAEGAFHVHPVVSTMMPRRNQWLKTFIHTWMRIKNRVYRGEAGLQLSINSTDEEERREIFGGDACTLHEIHDMMDGIIPFGRKITLNFAVADWAIEPAVLREWFDPAFYIVKLTPMHKTVTAEDNDICTAGDYTQTHPYDEHEAALKDAGFEVLVFIASREEDESRITCGNAILALREQERAGDGYDPRWAAQLGDSNGQATTKGFVVFEGDMVGALR